MTDRQIDKPRQNVTDLAAVTNVGRSERDTPTLRSRDIVIQVSIRKQINIHVSRAPGVFSRVRSVSTENSGHIVRAEQLIAPMAMMLTMTMSVK